MDAAVMKQESGITIAPSIDSFLMKVPVKGPVMETAGSTRILIELADSPKQAIAYAKKYNDLVFDISSILRSEYGTKMKEEKFMTEVWGILVSNLDLVYGVTESGYLSESLQSGKFDCSNSSFLVFDVAKELGITMEMVFAPRHLLVKTENFVFETTNGRYYPIKEIHDKYPIIYAMTADPEKIQSVTYNNRGIAYYGLGKFQQAIDDYDKAIGLNRRYAEAYGNRGNAYSGLRNFQQAIDDHNKAIELNPADAVFYYNRGNTYYAFGNFQQTIDDCNKAIDLDRRYAKAYGNRGAAHYGLGNFQKAIDDCTTAISLNPRYAEAHYNRAIAYKELGMEKEFKADMVEYDALQKQQKAPQ